MDTLARREGYKINDTDIAAVPWVRRTSAAPACVTVSLVEQHSSAPCTPEISFGCNDKGNVWTKMCRGRFRCQNNESFLCGYPPGRTSYECSCATGNLDVPTVKCEQRAKGPTRRRVVVVLVDAIHRPLFETKYPLSMKFGQQDHEVFHFKHHHATGGRALHRGWRAVEASPGPLPVPQEALVPLRRRRAEAQEEHVPRGVRRTPVKTRVE